MLKEDNQIKIKKPGRLKRILIVVVILLALNSLFWRVRDTAVKSELKPVIEKLKKQEKGILSDIEKHKDCFEDKELASYTPIAEKCYTGLKGTKSKYEKLVEESIVEIEELYSKVENELPEYDKDRKLLHDFVKIQKSDGRKKYYMTELEFLQAYIDLFDFIKNKVGTRTIDQLSKSELDFIISASSRIENAIKEMDLAEKMYIFYLEKNYSKEVVNLIKDKFPNPKK